MAFLPEIEDFGTFYERSYQIAYRTAYGIVGDAAWAADVVQDAFVSAYRARDKFRGEAPARAWLLRIVVNTAISAHRKTKVKTEELDESSATYTAGHGERLDLEGALSVLPRKQRAAIVLRYYHGFDYAEIAAMLGTTSGSVGSLLSRAVTRLRLELYSPHWADPASLPQEVRRVV